jgi:hypothetical protein
VNAVMNLRVLSNAGKLSSGLTTGGLSSSAQLHRVSSVSKLISAEVKNHTITPPLTHTPPRRNT